MALFFQSLSTIIHFPCHYSLNFAVYAPIIERVNLFYDPVVCLDQVYINNIKFKGFYTRNCFKWRCHWKIFLLKRVLRVAGQSE
ncbi:hypothetical protein QVD17_36407 [Tagetes erecta]|uniref:Uncharacterized protein n=1 Tax=Tagetes erecta TaxID=13708 RepID=A0AAD8NJ73_TARER|nr:hypothetical protein QVD17_36407 [Tagetes erecta]